MRWVLCLVLCALGTGGCYSPSATSGAPCSSTGACPTGQHCDYTLEPPTCSLADARPIDAPPDAPPTCATNADCATGTPVCDLRTSYCRGCSADAECGATDVCTELDGTCHNASNALFVAPLGAGMQCTRTAPCSLATAISSAANNQRIIVILDGVYGAQFSIPTSYASNSLTLSGTDLEPAGAVVTPGAAQALFVAANDKPLVVEGITFKNAPGAGVDNRGALLLSHVRIESNGTHGISASSTASLEVRDSVILNNMGNGIESDASVLIVARSHIVGNVSGGLDLRTAPYTIENSFITGNGTATSNFGGVRVGNVNAAQVFAFNTVAGNASVSAVGLDCPSTLVPDSCIFGDPVTGCTPTFSIMPGTDPMYAGIGDYHVLASSPAVDMANPAATQTTDVDRQARPQGAGRDIGADEAN